MTLLLTCITHRYIVQASDRRLTISDGAIHEELANKATLLGNHATFAYTGLAKCSATESTDILMLRVLSQPGISIMRQLYNLAVEAGRSIQNLQLPGVRPSERDWIRRTSFVGGGFLGLHQPERFGRLPSVDSLHPSLIVVSNAQGVSEDWRDTADREFSISMMSLEQDQVFGFHAAGARFKGEVRTKLLRDIRRCIARSEHPEPVARLLARAIREVSQRNRRVGPNVMCTLVHRERVLRNYAEYNSGAFPVNRSGGVPPEADYFKIMRDNKAQFIYSPGNAESLIFYGPNWASPSGLAFQGIIFGPTELVEKYKQGLNHGP